MATKGTLQYTIWKAKYEATKLRKQGEQSLFSVEETAKIYEQVKNFPKVEVHDLAYLSSNTPKRVQYDLWQKAAKRATANGTKMAAFSAVRAIYNNYLRRQEQQKSVVAYHMAFCMNRAQNEYLLNEMFNY